MNYPNITLNFKASKKSRNTWNQNYKFLFFILNLLRHFPANVSNSTLVHCTFYNDHSPFYDTSRSFNALEHSIRRALRSLHQLGLIRISFKKIYVRSVTVNNPQTAIPLLQRYFQNTPNNKIPTQVKDILKFKPIGTFDTNVKGYSKQHYNDFQELLSLKGEYKLSYQKQIQAFQCFIEAIRKFDCSADTIIASRTLYTSYCKHYYPKNILNWLKHLTFNNLKLMHSTFSTLEPYVLQRKKSYEGEDGFENRLMDNMTISYISEHFNAVYSNLQAIENAEQMPYELRNWRILLYLVSSSAEKIKKKVLDIFVSFGSLYCHRVYRALNPSYHV